MRTQLSKLALFAQKIDRQKLQVVFVLLSLALFVLGAGAPDSGGIGPK